MLEEVKTTICKSQKNITKYYNKYYILTSIFNLSNKIYLNFTNIHTIHSSAKLTHQYLELYTVEKQVSLISYRLKLHLFMKRLYLMFNIVKLTVVPIDLIQDQCAASLSYLVIVDSKKKQKVEQVLDSCQYHKRYQYLIKQKGFVLEANS